MPLKSITFNCEVITPMFCGNATQDAELRPSAIKGALRFWWRAMQNISDVAKLREQEAEIFGSSDEKWGGRSKVIVEVEKVTSFLPEIPAFTKRQIVNGRPVTIDLIGTSENLRSYYSRDLSSNILEYLSYGLHNYNTGTGVQFHRECFKPGEKFNILIRCSDQEVINIIEEVFKIFAWYGGVGAKTRNGFGQICIIDEKGNPKFTNPLLIENNNRRKNAFTAFSNGCQIFSKTHTPPLDSWDKALSEIGWAYRKSRLKLDLDRSNNLSAKGTHNYENRLYIAHPIEVKGETIPNFLERHSKTYFLFVNKLAPKQFQGGILHLPYNYSVEQCDKFKMNQWKETAHQKSTPLERYNEIHQVMNSNLNTELK